MSILEILNVKQIWTWWSNKPLSSTICLWLSRVSLDWQDWQKDEEKMLRIFGLGRKRGFRHHSYAFIANAAGRRRDHGHWPPASRPNSQWRRTVTMSKPGQSPRSSSVSLPVSKGGGSYLQGNRPELHSMESGCNYCQVKAFSLALCNSHSLKLKIFLGRAVNYKSVKLKLSYLLSLSCIT